MPKLDNKKLTLGQITALSVEERANVLKPIIKANEEQLTNFVKSVSEIANSNLAQALKSITIPKLELPNLDFIRNIKLPEFPTMPEPTSILDNHDFTFERYDPPVTIKKSEWEIEKEKRQAYVTELQIEILERQLNLVKSIQTPQYDQSTGIITFMGKSIEIPLNTNLEMVCRIVLKNVANMKRKWSWDEIVEGNREEADNFTPKTIYTAVRSVNEKVALETQIKDFLVSKPTSTVQLNPKFIAK
ncbi:MAG: hypothetical protein Q8P26_00585 [Candidatus Levybacteria bacterium]|nr:hypothetical protein [Candidatus Levybacteria bacterium]